MPFVRTIAAVAIGSLALAGVLFAAAARPAAPPAAPQPKEPVIGPGGILMDPPSPPPAAPVPGSAGAQPGSAEAKPGQWTVCPAPGKFITCLLATDTALWVGTEDASLWRLDLKADPAQAGSWKQFTTAETRTDNIYGLAQDAAGRLWVGTQNQGVSVFNGKDWKNYGVIDGPIGEHVFSIAADPDPARGSVWIATDHGLTSWTPDRPEGPESPKSKAEGPKSTTADTPSGARRVPVPAAPSADVAPPPSAVQPTDAASLAARAAAIDPFAAKGISDPTLAPGTWRTFTKADGLPSSQIYAVTVAPGGRVWVGTECDGLACSDPPYKTWQVLRAASEHSGDTPGAGGHAAAGWFPGLPSNLTNALLALPDGSVAYSTNYGLALSRDAGRTWRSWQGVSTMAYENYLRGLAYDKTGGLWIATRHKGLVRLDLATGAHKTFAKPQLPDDYVFDVAVSSDGSIFAGTYGEGLARMVMPGFAGPTAHVAAAEHRPDGQPLPAPAAPPTLDQVNAVLAALSKYPSIPGDQQLASVRLGDDWLTKGDWLGRHGRFASLLCAMKSPASHFYGVGWQPGLAECIEMIGTHSTANDSVRYWVHWLYTTNPNAMEMAPDHLASRITEGLTQRAINRRQSEIDDHSESYPLHHDGPHLYFSVHVPPGQYSISLYFFNKDGEHGNNRLRDYLITLKAGRFTAASLYGDWMKPKEEAIYEELPTLAIARVRDFRGGVYKRFLVSGPAWYGIKISRNHSFCTICSGLMMDLMLERPAPYYWRSPDGSATIGGLLNAMDDFSHNGHREEYLNTRAAQDGAARNVLSEEFQKRPKDFQARFIGRAGLDDAANCLFSEGDWLRLRNPQAWASIGQWLYACEARHYRQASTVNSLGGKVPLERTGTCYYELGLFALWEETYKYLGIMTARSMELGSVDEHIEAIKILDKRGGEGNP
jgi:hypothetical protein